MFLQSMTVGEQLPTVPDLMASQLANYTTLAADDFVYGGTAEDLIINYIHPLFLKAKSAASREDNPNWNEATTGVFAENYWKSMKVDIATLEYIGDWLIVDRGDYMNVIDSARYFKSKHYTDGLIKKIKARLCVSRAGTECAVI